MKLRSLAGGACCLLILACGGADREANAGEPEEMVAVVDDAAALAELTDYYQTHYNLHHASMVSALYAEDANFLAANGRGYRGREVITAYLEETMSAISPELTVEQADLIMASNWAVTRGSYSVAGEVDGDAVGFSGSFLNFLNKESGDWRIRHAQTNYDSETTDDRWLGAVEGAEPPAEEGMLGDLIAAYETHYNLGHASMVADLFTEDAVVSFPGSAWITGREAVVAALEAGMEGSPQIDIHDVDSGDLGDGMMGDDGWYETTVDGGPDTWGTYHLLAKQNAEGNWQIHWLVGNVSPAAN